MLKVLATEDFMQEMAVTGTSATRKTGEPEDRKTVIPDFASKTKYSLYVCPGSIVPHIRTKSVYR
jgi:hypothetical protein